MNGCTILPGLILMYFIVLLCQVDGILIMYNVPAYCAG